MCSLLIGEQLKNDADTLQTLCEDTGHRAFPVGMVGEGAVGNGRMGRIDD